MIQAEAAFFYADDGRYRLYAARAVDQLEPLEAFYVNASPKDDRGSALPPPDGFE
jgi:hypothetical protein